MVNEKRVRLMTRLTVFEKKHDSAIMEASTYFRSDYIGIHILKNIFRITLAFLLGMSLWICYHVDDLMEKLNVMDIEGIGFQILVAYVIVLGLFLALTYIIYTIKFLHADQQLQFYRVMLDQLVKEYEAEDEGVKRARTRTRMRTRERSRASGGRQNGRNI